MGEILLHTGTYGVQALAGAITNYLAILVGLALYTISMRKLIFIAFQNIKTYQLILIYQSLLNL